MSQTIHDTLRILIASPLEAEHVARIAAVSDRISLLHAPDLLPTPRYAGDHQGDPRELTVSEQSRWNALLATAEVSFDFDPWRPEDMPANAPALRWIQATSSGIGEFVRAKGLDRSELVLTTAAGIHAAPLAEFTMLGLLYLTRDIPNLIQMQNERRWERFTSRSLQGQTVLVVGLGNVGRAVAALLDAAGATVWGAIRPGHEKEVPGVSRSFPITHLTQELPHIDALVLACPLTSETYRLIGKEQFAEMPSHAVLVNVARGQVVDESAMIDALNSGRLSGAVLDVFEKEPLPDSSPLWDMSNVLVSPHSASTLADENARIVDLFVDNLARYLAGDELLNVYARDNQY